MKKPKNIPLHYSSKGTPIYRDTTGLPFLDGGPLVDKTDHGKLLNSVYASALGNYYAQGGMIKRADGSYSQRGLWDNIRANRGSGKEPTKQMLEQERKINREYRNGGQFPTPYSLPEDSFKQGGRNLHNSVYASSMAQYPAVYKYGGSFEMPRQQMYMPLDNVERYGGAILSMSNTPQLEGEGKDLVYKNGGHMYLDGGPFYTYSGRPGAQYKKDAQGKWMISLNGKEFVPIKDPSGSRTKVLNAQAQPLSPYLAKEMARRQAGLPMYDPLQQKAIPSETTRTVAQNSMGAASPAEIEQNKARVAQLKVEASKRLAQEYAHDEGMDYKAALERAEKVVEQPDFHAGDFLAGRMRADLGQGDPSTWTAKTSPGHSTLKRTWEIATNPFTAFEYAVSGGGVGNMPHNINEMRVAGIDPGVVQGRNLVGNALNSNINLLDAGDKVIRNVQKGDYSAALGEGIRFIPAGVGAVAGSKELLKQAERLGLKNVVKGKASISDLFKRDDLINVKTVEDLTAYKKAVAEGTLSPTRNRYYSSLKDNPDALNYAKGQEQVFVHRVPQTKAASVGKSLANIKPEGAGLIARERSIPTIADVDNLIASGKLSGYSPETIQGLREVAANPEGYQNLDIFKSNPELQTLVKDPNLVNPAEHLLPRPSVEDFTLMPVAAIGVTQPALIEGSEIINKALEGMSKSPTFVRPQLAQEDTNNYKFGGNMNFKSNAAYKAWLAHGHASGEFARTPGNQPVSIKGKSHDVQHNMGGMLYAAGGSFNNPGFAALPPAVQNKIRTNSFVNGGTMDQLTEFKTGGKHEENPLGGIPQGMSSDGRLNLVEEGEMKRKPTAEGGGNDAFIYSDSITVDKKFAKLYAIPKSFIGKTYAEAAKLAARPDSRRENDTIEQADIKRKIDSIAAAQEAQKAEAEREEKAKELAANPELLDALMGQLATNQSVQPMGMPQGEQVSPDQVPQELLAQMEGAQQGMPIMKYGGNMYACGGKMYAPGGWLEENQGAVSGAAQGFLSGAATGAAMGAATGPLAFLGAPAGALIGGTISAFAQGSKGAQEDEARADAKLAEQNAQYAQSAANPNVGVATAGMPVTPMPGTAPMYPNYQTNVARKGGTLPSYHQYPQSSEVRFANNAGPMGQPLTNLYAPGGFLDTPMPPDNAPEGTPFNLADRNSWMGSYTSIPMGHDLTLPISSLPGIGDQIKTGLATPNYKTVGDYITDAENWERNPTLGLSPGPVSIIPTSSTTTTAPSKPTPPSTDGTHYYLHPYTGQPVYDVNPSTGEKTPRIVQPTMVDGKSYPALGPIQYSNFLEMQANNPYKHTAPGGKFAMGGSIETFNPNISNSFDADMPVRKLVLGGIDDPNYDWTADYNTRMGITNPDASRGLTTAEAKLATQNFDPYVRNNELDQAQVDMNNAETDEEFNAASEKYQSLLKRLNESLPDQNVDMSIGMNPLALAAMAAPAAVNIGRGLFGKPMQLNYKDYISNANIQAPEFNINPQLADANATFAAANAAAKNASISGGNYANFLRELANMRNKTKGELYAQKENIDAANKMKADMANAEINRQNLASRYNIDMANAQALAAKQAMLSTGLSQVGQIGEAALKTAADKTMLKAIAPTFANSLNLELLNLLKKENTNKEGK